MSSTGGSANPGGGHLMIVFDTAGPDLVIVPVVSNHRSDTCNLNVGDHPFLTHSSRIDFSFLRKVPKKHIIEAIEAGTYRLHEPVTRDFARKMYEAFFVSDDVEGWAEKMCSPRVKSYLNALGEA